MCGIVGYVGHNSAQEVLLNGLEKLEYRGYDSAGIYIVDKKNAGHLFKEKGCIQALQDKVEMAIDASLGIGHTRWATHGKPSVVNAHPHKSNSGRFHLVHNGVIENYDEIKELYLPYVDFYSTTDTEVAVELIEYFALKDESTAEEAFRSALKIIRGSFAFALIDREQPGKVFAAKNKSPLLIGKGEDFNTIASDAMATIGITDQYIEIEDGEMVTLTADAIKIQTINGEMIEREPYTAAIDANDLEKGTYPYYMLKEIDEQPAVIRNIVQKYGDDNGDLAVDQAILDAILASDRIHIVAAGTSNHAGWVGKHFLERIAGIPTEVHVSSEFSYNPPLLSKKPFFIFISQSGETADSRQVLVKVNQGGYAALTITNVKGSTLSREAKFTMLLHAGPEIAVASTKAYTAQIAVLAVLADALAHKKGLTQVPDIKHELGILAASMDTIVDDKERYHILAKTFFEGKRNAFYIGRGLDYYVSMEAALKLKEISYIQTEGFAAGELKHGTIALIEEGTPVVAIITQERTATHTRGNIEEVRSRGAHTITIVMEGLERADDQIVLPKVHPALTPLMSVIPAQLLAYYATLERGYDVDKPRNLAKSVTVE